MKEHVFEFKENIELRGQVHPGKVSQDAAEGGRLAFWVGCVKTSNWFGVIREFLGLGYGKFM